MNEILKAIVLWLTITLPFVSAYQLYFFVFTPGNRLENFMAVSSGLVGTVVFLFSVLIISLSF